jgi:hypothetical protein
MTQIVNTVIDKLTQIKMTCPPSLIKTAIRITVANPVGQALIRRMVRLGAPLISQANVKEFHFPDSASNTDKSRGDLVRFALPCAERSRLCQARRF